MSHEIDLAHLPDYALVSASGQATTREFRQILAELVSDPRWVRGTPYVWDVRRLLVEHTTAEDMLTYQSTIVEFRDRLGDPPCAMVVGNAFQQKTFGVYADRLAAAGLERPFGVFLDLDEALAWVRGFGDGEGGLNE